MKSYLILICIIPLSPSLYAQWGQTTAENLKLSEEQGVKLNKLVLAGPEGSWYICYTNLVVNTQSTVGFDNTSTLAPLNLLIGLATLVLASLLLVQVTRDRMRA